MRRLIPWVAVVLSGAAALSHELLWTRRLVDLLGATHEASARVIACFFLGLSLGAALTPAILRRTARPWRLAGLIEVGVAVLCLPLFFLPDLYTNLWQQLGPEQLGTPKASALKLLVSALFIVPPALLMGTTLPLMVAGLLQSQCRLERHGIWLYALNTAGGVAGIVLSTHLTLWLLGVRGAMLVAMGLNIATAILCLLLDATRETTPKKAAKLHVTESAIQDQRQGWQLTRMPMILAFFSGFGVLAFEILCIHLFSHVVSNLNAITTVLAAFIFLLFLAALAVPYVVPRIVAAETAIVAALTLSAMFITTTPFIFMVISRDLSRLYENFSSVFTFFMSVAALVFLCAGIAVFFAGMIFPLAIAAIENEDRSANIRWGLLLAVNGIGGTIGAEFVNNVVISKSGLYAAFGVIGIAYAAVALLVATVTVKQRSALTNGLCIFALVACLTMTIVFLPHLPVVNANLGAEIVETFPGPDGVIAIVERTFPLATGTRVSRSMVWDSQYTLGGTFSKPYERRQVILPLMLHPQPEKVLSLGLATGISAGAALDIPGVAELTAVELSQQVVDAAQKYYSMHNRHIFKDAKAKIIVEDARTYVDACQDEFDIVVADFFRPHATGEGRLFSVEHFVSVKDALRDGGHFCQWIPCYQTSAEEWEVILASFLSVFDKADVWRVNLTTQYTALGLVGYKRGEPDFAGLADRCTRLREARSVFDPPCRHAEGIVMHYVGRLEHSDVRTEQHNTLDNLWLELRGGRPDATNNAFNSSLVNANFKAFEDELYRRADRGPAGKLARWIEVGHQFSGWNYAKSKRDPDQEEMLTAARGKLPESMVQDDAADWSYWPE